MAKQLTPEQAEAKKLARRARRAARKERKAAALGMDTSNGVDRAELRRRAALARDAAAMARITRMQQEYARLVADADHVEQSRQALEERYAEALSTAVNCEGDLIDVKAAFDKADRAQATLLGVGRRVANLRTRAQDVADKLTAEGRSTEAPVTTEAVAA